jgi:hypothetical protein
VAGRRWASARLGKLGPQNVMQDTQKLLQYLDTLQDQRKSEERLRLLREALAAAWDEGLDFTGAALRGGCSLTEAATGNPYR